LLNVHAKMVLQNSYCQRLKAQLGAEERKTKKTRSKKIRLHSDGMPRILTNDKFYEQVVEAERVAEREENQRLQRAAARKAYDQAVEDWQQIEDARKTQNIALKLRYAELKKNWENERDRAKRARTKPRWDLPKCGPLGKQIPRP
ncbi:hypothetical protein BKA62DRAFT_596829, partial [Auriculariales sp. MPI-PUGE-AT-0066]